ncbi:MAG: DUF1653 domain-containing protein [Candidatus Paceibacterota bacterium]
MKTGIYKHSKSGNLVKVLGVVKHSETLEDLVLYDHMGTNELSDLWVRPIKMFEEEVYIDGKKLKRFEFINEV